MISPHALSANGPLCRARWSGLGKHGPGHGRGPDRPHHRGLPLAPVTGALRRLALHLDGVEAECVQTLLQARFLALRDRTVQSLCECLYGRSSVVGKPE